MPNSSPDVSELENKLNSFDPDTRHDALISLKRLADERLVELLPPKRQVNLHFHTFYSFNALGWSPSRVAWEAKKYGLEAAGKVDFDVLEGMEEFHEAGALLGLKTVCGLETRVFIREYASDMINSPGEPGIAYFMAAGCYQEPSQGSPAGQTLTRLYQTARSRNEELMARVNAHLAPVAIEYRNDVLPLTPSQNATERHLLEAYHRKARDLFPDDPSLAEFWKTKLDLDGAIAAGLVKDPVKLQETIRARLMKQGGIAYVQPDTGSFPSIESVIDMAKEIGALPCATWLDGTNPGEDNMDEMLSLLESKGVVAANIIPDRNWNIKDASEKQRKLAKLDEMVQAARKHAMPLCIGTEMNKLGLPFVDNFAAPELQPYIQDFMDGACFLWGHTLLARYAGYGYFSPQVEDAFGKARARRNKFFQLVGRLSFPSPEKLQQLRGLDLDPEHLLVWLQKG